LIGEMRFPEIWTPLAGRFFTHTAPPLVDLLVVARQQHLGDVEPFERPRSRVLRMLEEAVLEAFFQRALDIPQNTRGKSNARLDHDHRRRLATGENRVSDRDLLEPAGVEHPLIHYIWMGLFTILLLINLKRVVMPVKSPHGDGEWGQAALAIPLYAQMAIISGLYFLIKGHHAGLAIYINQLMELPSIFMNLGLFIWSGMLLKQSRIVDLFMNTLRPWSMSPQLLTYIILLASAVPTAYTGGSAAFVIAAGAIVFHEVRSVGGSRQFALAAAAMSGSLGVVLNALRLSFLTKN